MTTIDRNTLVLLDASCLIAAAGRPDGGSGFVLSLCARRLLRGAVSQPILVEAERNIATKVNPAVLDWYHRLVTDTPLEVAAIGTEVERESAAAIVGAKDDHVLASALTIAAPFLLTLDRRLVERVDDASLSVRAFSPGDFITGVLPAHADFPSLRTRSQDQPSVRAARS